MVPTLDLTGRRIIITGAASGIGAGLVSALTGQGADVAAFDLDEERGAKIAADVGAGFFQCDVSDQRSVTNAVEALVNAAGVAPGSPAADTPLDMWQQCMNVNATGTFLTNLAVVSHLQAAGGGQILNFASGAGIDPYPGKAAYAASKGAVLSWGRTVAVEWAKFGITVNSICPLMSTAMYETTRASKTPEELVEFDKFMAMTVPLGRMGDVQADLVPMISLLCSDGAKFMTGQAIVVDGGASMAR
jgi:NAD(P)-dependent dehydrogenase (short-subunit alcohol dehydrogenase family)